MRTFAELDFVAKHENLMLTGPTGVGKTGLACGLLLKALQNGHRCQFVRAQDLFDEMYASLADRSTRQLLNRLARLDVLPIDEFGYLNLRPEQSNIFFKLMEERYHRHSTIVTTNLGYDEWQNFLGNKSMVEALNGRGAAEPRSSLLSHGHDQWPVAARTAGLRLTGNGTGNGTARIRAAGSRSVSFDAGDGGRSAPCGSFVRSPAV